MKNIKIDLLLAVVLILICSTTAFFIGRRVSVKPIIITEVQNEILSNKIGEQEEIIRIRKLPPDSVVNILQKYYKNKDVK